MAIEFACPNGHRLSCPDQFAGRSSKCPKCGATFQVPAPEVAAAPAASAAVPAAVGADESGAADASPLGTAEPGGAVDETHRFAPPEEDGAGLFDNADGFPDFTGDDSALAPAASPSALGAASLAAGDSAEVAAASGVGSGSDIGAAASGAPAEQPTPAAPVKPPAQKPAAGAAIVFLCPAGHKLNAPAALAGRAGKCPHCGAKFVIPGPDEPEEAEPAAFPDFTAAGSEPPQRPAGPPPLPQADGAAATEAEPASPTAAEAELPFDFAEIAAAGEAADESSGASGADRPVGNMRDAFARLWQDRAGNSVVEIRLQCGDLVVPDWYSSQLSAESYGLFATQDKDGRFTLTAVNWQSVERISVRGIDELPDSGFE